MRKKALMLAEKLREMPRDDDDLRIAKMLEELSEAFELTYEFVKAKSHHHKMTIYAELESYIKGVRSNGNKTQAYTHHIRNGDEGYLPRPDDSEGIGV